MSSKKEVLVVLLWLLPVNFSLASDECNGCVPLSGPDIFGGVNIDTSKVIPIETDPLVVRVNLKGRQSLCNTGSKLIQLPIDPSYQISTASGGLLCRNNYTFCRTNYFWSLDRKKNAGSTIDDEGCQLQVEGIFYNSRYKSCQEAVDDDDELIDIVACYNVEGFLRNPSYNKFAQAVQKVLQCGTCVEVDGTELNSPIVKEYSISNYTPYYGYRSTYDSKDFRKNITFNVFRLSNTAKIPMSLQQFYETFGALQDCSNCSYSNSVGIYNSADKFNAYEGGAFRMETIS